MINSRSMMVKYGYGIICCFLVFCSGCLFSGPDNEERKLVSPYFIVSAGAGHDLVVKEENADTEKIIYSNIDSIGWSNHYIFGKAQSGYFIIDCNAQKIVGRYSSAEFNRVKKGLGLQSGMVKPTDL